MTAAVINRQFCEMLLADPAMAVASGYSGEVFHLASEDQELILSIRAESLADFAKQLTQNHNGHNGHSHNRNGNGHNPNNYLSKVERRGCGRE